MLSLFTESESTGSKGVSNLSPITFTATNPTYKTFIMK